MCHRRAMVSALLVTYNKCMCDTRNTEGKRVFLNTNIIINIIISYVVFLMYIFFLLKITLPMDSSDIRYMFDKSIEWNVARVNDSRGFHGNFTERIAL